MSETKPLTEDEALAVITFLKKAAIVDCELGEDEEAEVMGRIYDRIASHIVWLKLAADTAGVLCEKQAELIEEWRPRIADNARLQKLVDAFSDELTLERVEEIISALREAEEMEVQ